MLAMMLLLKALSSPLFERLLMQSKQKQKDKELPFLLNQMLPCYFLQGSLWSKEELVYLIQSSMILLLSKYPRTSNSSNIKKLWTSC